MYLDCVSEDVDPKWKLKKSLTSPNFQLKMGDQMCLYRATKCLYPGDNFLCKNSSHSIKQRKTLQKELENAEDGKKRFPYSHYPDTKHPWGKDTVTRLCSSDLGLIKEHLNSYVKTLKSMCHVFGKECFFKCGKYGKHTHLKKDLKMTNISCCLDFHNDNYFGLVLDDRLKLLES